MKISIRSTMLVTAGALVGAVGVMALRPAVLPLPAGSGVTGIAPAEAALLRPISEFQVENLPVDQAVAKLSQLGGIPITLETEQLRKAGMTFEGGISLGLRGRLFIEVLDELTREINARLLEENPKSIDWILKDDRLVLTVAGDDDNRGDVITRAYDVAHWVAANSGSADPSPPPVLGGPSSAQAQLMLDLKHFIQETVRADSWRINGGYAGSIFVVGDRLVVTHTIPVHAQIRKLLADISRPVQAVQEAAQIPESPEVFRYHFALKRWISTNDERGDEQLRRVIEEFQATNLTAGQALDKLATENGLNLMLADQTAKVVAIEWLPSTRRLSVGMRNAPVWQIIREILRQAEAAPEPPAEEKDPVTQPPVLSLSRDAAWPRHRYTWWVDGGLIIVGNDSTKASVTRLYALQPIMDAINPVLAAASPPKVAMSLEETGARLELAIVQEIQPDSWRTAGGAMGSVRTMSRHLVVTHNWETQEMIRHYLQKLRAKPRPLPATEAQQ